MPLKKHRRNLLLAALVALVPVSLHAGTPSAAWDANGMIQGNDSGYSRQNEFQQYFIDNETKWKWVWKGLRSSLSSQNPPHVDFKKELVIVTMSGPKPTTGWALEMAKRVDPRDPDHLIIFYWDLAPTPETKTENKTTSLFAVLKVKKHSVVELLYGKPFDLAERETGLAGPFKPGAEVHADKGAIRLTLRVAKTKMRPDESAWYQLALKNIGTESMLIRDPIFWDPGHGYTEEPRIDMEYVGRTPGPTGESPGCFIDCGPITKPIMTMAQHAELDALRIKWEKDGDSDFEIFNKTSDFVNESENKNYPQPTSMTEVDPILWVRPGGEIQTFGWAYNGSRDDKTLRPVRLPFRDYIESHGTFSMGKYTVRGFYKYGDFVKAAKRVGIKPFAEDVTLKTPSVTIEVAP